MKKNKFWTFFFALIPGAGQMYLGSPRQGLQLMTLFTLTISIAGWMDFEILGVLAPIIWFFSFFDTFNKANSEFIDDSKNILLLSWLNDSTLVLKNKGKILGYILLILGVYLVFEKIVTHFISYQIRNYLQTGVVAVLLIIFGIKLLSGSKKNWTKSEEDSDL